MREPEYTARPDTGGSRPRRTTTVWIVRPDGHREPLAVRDLLDPQGLVGKTLEVDLLEMVFNAPAYDDRVTVMIQHPEMPQAFESTYGCSFKHELAVGDLVLCPPAPLWPIPFQGMVTALTGNGYRGPVKYLIKKINQGDGETNARDEP